MPQESTLAMVMRLTPLSYDVGRTSSSGWMFGSMMNCCWTPLTTSADIRIAQRVDDLLVPRLVSPSSTRCAILMSAEVVRGVQQQFIIESNIQPLELVPHTAELSAISATSMAWGRFSRVCSTFLRRLLDQRAFASTK